MQIEFEPWKVHGKHSMVSIAIMVGEAIINATAFFGGSYLAKYFTGDHNKADEDKKQHDLVVEKYQVPYKKYQAS